MADLSALQNLKLAKAIGADPDDEISSSLDRPLMKFSLDGDPVPGHEVEAGILGRWLVALQNAISSVAYSLDDARLRYDSGPIPREIHEATKLLAGASFPSSYGMVLEASRESQQTALPGTSLDYLLDSAVNRIFDVADKAENGEDEAVLDAAVPLGRRAIGHLSELSGVLASAGANITLSWQPHSDELRVSRLTTSSAARCRAVLKSAEVEDSHQQITGNFIGSTQTRGFIEIETTDGVVVVHAPRDEVVGHSANLWHRRVVVDVRVTTARYPSGGERRTYRLVKITEESNRS
ncbi:hypothetical protein [Streptomyces bohaiensis]|uniref:hypothetical protein n=1 Tax=Streptomyces bohaiensis TaxID=1431344 RepID=UPI003B7E34CC